MQFDIGNTKIEDSEYKLEKIENGVVYTRESEGHLPDLYYPSFWEGYYEKKNI